jgi:hypothetical protein
MLCWFVNIWSSEPELSGQAMSEDDLVEFKELTRAIGDLELKLTFWQHERQVCEQMVEKITERMGVLGMRQKSLIEGNKVARAAG